MKKLFCFVLVAVLLLPTLSGCNSMLEVLQNYGISDNQNRLEYQVTFVSNNGASDIIVPIEAGKTVPTPTDPLKTNYLFRGWYTDSTLTQRYDFAQPVTQNLSLYAKYEIDATALTNKISTDIIKGVVKIYNKSYNSFLGIETASSTAQGSGFCFHIENGCYYILTNCHVAMKNASYDKQKITIEDYQGNTYEGYIYINPDTEISAIAASYDLACLYFKPSSTNVKKLSIDASNPDVGADVISIGAPKGQSNSITYGKILGYGDIVLSDASPSLSNVTFDVIGHNAYINNGSSGGPLLNADLDVVGVNYAGSESENFGASIPAEKVYEFLKEYVYN